jgi:hypothetical protein
MGPRLTPTFRRLANSVAGILFGLCLAVGLAGCPTAADLEDPGRFPALDAGDTGGTSMGTGGTSVSGTGGGGGGGPVGCDHALPDVNDPEIMCNYTAAVGSYCSKGGCHGTAKAGGLDLRLNPGFISRLVDQPAIHRITCNISDVCDRMAMPPTCAKCSMCPSNALLIDSTNVDNSWVLTKMAAYMPPMGGSTNVDIGCGDQMPSLLTSGIDGYAQADKDCLTKFFKKIAKTEGTFPCNSAAAGAGGMSGAGGMTVGGAGGSGGGAGSGGMPMSGAGGT